MQRFHCKNIWFYCKSLEHLQIGRDLGKDLVVKSQRHRRFATRHSPGFGSSTPPSTAARSHKSKPANFDPKKSSSKERTAADGKPANKTKPPRKFPIGPGKILVFSIFAYLGYKVYIWDTNPKRSRILDPRNFTPFILEKREKVSSTSSILHLASLPKGQNTDNVAEAWKTGVWSVQAMQPELQIARSYTPLPPAETAEPEELRLFVRKEPQGEVSSFLHRISRGTLVHLRGPQIEYQVPDDVNEVLFLAGGTGIAPALQIAHILFNYRTSGSESGPKMRILWANRRSEDSYARQGSPSPEQPPRISTPKLQDLSGRSQSQPKKEILEDSEETQSSPSRQQTALIAEVESLKARYPGKVEVDYFVDEEGSQITNTVLRDCLSSTDRRKGESSPERPVGKKILLVSGPEGFVDFYAGPKSMRGGKELQGPLGGVLQQVNLQGWEIWKL